MEMIMWLGFNLPKLICFNQCVKRNNFVKARENKIL